MRRSRALENPVVLISRFNRYPYFNVAQASPRVKAFPIALEEVRSSSHRPRDFMTGPWEPASLDCLHRVAQLRHMFAMRKNRILLRRYAHVAEFGGEPRDARHLYAAQVVDSIGTKEAQTIVRHAHLFGNFAVRSQAFPLRGNARPGWGGEVATQSRDQHGLAAFKARRIKLHYGCLAGFVLVRHGEFSCH